MKTNDLTNLILQKLSAVPDAKLAVTKQEQTFAVWLEDANGTTFKVTIEQK
jgi:hypothetical protein